MKLALFLFLNKKGDPNDCDNYIIIVIYLSSIMIFNWFPKINIKIKIKIFLNDIKYIK